MKNTITILVLFFSVQSFATNEEEFKKIFNEIIDGNSRLFREIIETNPDYHHDNLVESLIVGDKPHVTEGLLEEITRNSRNTLKMLEGINQKINKNPKSIDKINSSLVDIRKQISLGKITKPSALRCAALLGVYFSFRDYAYSYRATFLNEDKEAELDFSENIGFVDTGIKYYLPMLCLSEMNSHWPKYKAMFKEGGHYLNKKKNIKLIQKALDDFNLKPEARQQMSNYVSFSEEQKALLIKDVLTDKATVGNQKILKQYEKFLRKIDFNLFANGLSHKVSPELLKELKKLIGKNKKSDLDINKVMNYYDYLSHELDELFLREINRGGDKSYLALKESLQKARESELKNSKIQQKMDTKMARCLAFVGTSLFLGSHAAAIGTSETPFDNIDDTWYRKNHNYLFYPVTAGIIPMCLYEFPGYFRNRKLDNIRKDELKLKKLSIYDWEHLEQKLEKAKKNATIKRSKPKSSDIVLKKAEAAIFKDLTDKYSDLLKESSTKKFHNSLDRFNSGEKKVLNTLVSEVKAGEFSLFNELIDSTNQVKLDSLVESITKNDLTKSSMILKEIKGNEADIIKYMVALQKKIKSDPQMAKGVKSSLKELNNILKLNKIAKPTPYACMAAIAGYFGTRDFLFSLYGNYIIKENTKAYEGLMDAATSNIVAFTAMFCIADMVMLKKELPKYIKAVLADKNAKKLIKELDSATDALQSDKKLRQRISRIKVLPAIQGKKEIQFFDELIRKVNPELEEEPRSIKEAWKKYKTLGFLNKKIQELKSKLPLQDRKILMKFLNKGQFSSAAENDYNYVISRTISDIEVDFKKWIEVASPLEGDNLLSELYHLKEKQRQMIEKIKKVPLGNKLCMWSMATAIAGVGYSAAVGHKKTIIDTKAEELERNNAQSVYMASAGVFLGACGVNALFAVPRGVKRKNLKRSNLLKMEPKDWDTLEQAIKKTKKEVGINPNSKGAPVRAIDLLTSTVSKLTSGREYMEKQRSKAKSKEQKFKKNMTAAKPGVLNIDKKCLEDGVKSILKGL